MNIFYFFLFYCSIYKFFDNNNKKEDLTEFQKNNCFNKYYREFLSNCCNLNNNFNNFYFFNINKKFDIINNYFIEYLPKNIYNNSFEYNLTNLYKNNIHIKNNNNILNFENLNKNIKLNNIKINFNIIFCKLFFKILNFEKQFFFKNNKIYSFSNIFWNGFYLNEKNEKLIITKTEQYNLNEKLINIIKTDLIIDNFLEKKVFNLNKDNLNIINYFNNINVSFLKKINNVNFNFSKKMYYNLTKCDDNSYFIKNPSMHYFYENFSIIEWIYNYFINLNFKKNYFNYFFFIFSKHLIDIKIFFSKNNLFFFRNLDIKEFFNNSFFLKGLSLIDKDYFYNIHFFKINYNFYYDLIFKLKNELKKFNFNYFNFFLSYNKYKNELLDYNFIRFDERFKKHFFKISYKTSNQNLILTGLFLYDFKFKKYYNSLLDFYINNAKPVLLIFYDFFKKLIIPVFVFIYILVSLILSGYLPFNKILFAWLVSIMSFYWLMSGFVFFVKKYQYSNFTAAIQRFWKRSYIIFWILEIFVFLIFMYLTLNANQESFYMFDNIQFFKTKLFSWRSFIFKLYPITFLLILSNIFILALRWTIFNKLSIWLIVFSGGLLYIFWGEFYQFMFISTYHTNFDWIFDFDEYKWEADIDEFKTRNINNFVVLLIVLKFWHIVFIIFFWLFFVLRSLELTKVTYTLFSVNAQNMLILYIFSWILMYPWFKYVFRHFLDMPYKWFYVNNRNLFNRVIFYDYNIFYKGVLDFNFYYNYKFNLNNFIYLNSVNKNFNFSSFRKDYITNSVITSLNNIK